jgi:hypothetical protein
MISGPRPCQVEAGLLRPHVSSRPIARLAARRTQGSAAQGARDGWTRPSKDPARVPRCVVPPRPATRSRAHGCTSRRARSDVGAHRRCRATYGREAAPRAAHGSARGARRARSDAAATVGGPVLAAVWVGSDPLRHCFARSTRPTRRPLRRQGRAPRPARPSVRRRPRRAPQTRRHRADRVVRRLPAGGFLPTVHRATHPPQMLHHT